MPRALELHVQKVQVLESDRHRLFAHAEGMRKCGHVLFVEDACRVPNPLDKQRRRHEERGRKLVRLPLLLGRRRGGAAGVDLARRRADTLIDAKLRIDKELITSFMVQHQVTTFVADGEALPVRVVSVVNKNVLNTALNRQNAGDMRL